MRLPLQINFRGLDHSDAVEERIRDKVAMLERVHPDITRCRVVVERTARSGRKGHLFHIHIDLTVSGAEIAVAREPVSHDHEDVNVAIRDAFEAARKQLQRQLAKRRGRVKVHTDQELARVINLFPDQGYGFAQTPEGDEVYFHKNAVADDRFGEIEVGNEVRLTVRWDESDNGPQASTVELRGRHQLPRAS